MRVACELLLGLTVVSLALLAAASRSRVDTFAFTAYDSRENTQVYAYAPIVGEALAAVPNPADADVPRVRETARRWVHDAACGKLNVPIIESFTDTTEEGVKQQIYVANYKLVEVLNFVAGQERLAGRYEQSAQDAMLALDTEDAVRCFDLFSILKGATIERSSVAVLKAGLPHYPSALRSEIERRLNEVPLKAAQIASVVGRSRVMFQVLRIDKGLPLEQAFDTSRRLPLGVLENADIRQLETRLKAIGGKDGDRDESQFISIARVACRAARYLQQDIRTTLQPHEAHTHAHTAVG
jgi:hypothetical protein